MTHRILVVDDNPTNLKLACEVLEMAGYQVDRAVDAIEALSRIGRVHPDLILMDVALPGIDGLTLARMLKRDEATQRIAIVALTAFAMKGDDEKAFDAGCDAYISKPIDARRLPLQVAEILGQRNRQEKK